MNIRVNDIPEEHMIDVFIGTLKDNIQHEVPLWEPDSLEKAFRLARKIESKIMVTRNPTTHIYKYGSAATPRLPKPTSFTTQKLEEKRENGFSTVVSQVCWEEIILHRLWRGGRKWKRNLKRWGYTPVTNPR